MWRDKIRITNVNRLISINIGNGSKIIGDLTAIDWASGIYFIKTEMDITGGTSYTISGSSQLLTVPYAFHAKTAENISGEIVESDPLFTDSQASNLTASDIINLGNISGVNSGDQDISGIEDNFDALELLTSEQRTQDSAIAINTAKVTYPSADAAKLSNIEANATADQTDTDIKTGYENNADTNAFTDAEKALLANQSNTNSGDQDISGIVDNFDAIEVLEADQITQNSAIALNTEKETNATHTGDVTGAAALIITDNAVTLQKIGTAGVADANKALTTDANGDPQWTASQNGFIIGEIKQSIGTMPQGLVKLTGQTISSLSQVQQDNAVILNLSGNLPNANNAYLSQNGRTLGDVSGENTVKIDRNQLPNYSLTGSTSGGGSHSHSISRRSNPSEGAFDPGNDNKFENSAITSDRPILGSFNTSSSGNHSHSFSTSSLNGGVTQRDLDIKPITLSVNTYMYLGF